MQWQWDLPLAVAMTTKLQILKKKGNLKLKSFTITTNYSDRDETNNSVETFTLEYGENGYVSTIIGIDKHFNDNGKEEVDTRKTIYTYNDKNQIIKEYYAIYEDNTTTPSESDLRTYTYNDEGLIQSEILIFNDKIINSEYIYEYNDKKQLIKKTRKNNNSSSTEITTYEYDAKGNLTKQSGGYGENKTFTFDDKKNVSSLLHLFPKEFNLI